MAASKLAPCDSGLSKAIYLLIKLRGTKVYLLFFIQGVKNAANSKLTLNSSTYRHYSVSSNSGFKVLDGDVVGFIYALMRV